MPATTADTTKNAAPTIITSKVRANMIYVPSLSSR